jgi:hypothetical protein
MTDISNKTLAALVVVAIVASLGSTFVLLNKTGVASTGQITGEAKVNVTAVVAISLPVNTVDFGTVYQGFNRSTDGGSPAPLVLQNDGGVNVNVSASGTALFGGTGGGDNTASFQYKARDDSEPGSFTTGASVTTYVNVATTARNNFIANLKYGDATDSSYVDLKISVPYDETVGQKTSTLTFIATQA